ncbi:MAG: DUF58 domain-containing protein [Deltaproteobacteria bacterium]|nr:DUF58 domain-containing protein [Deltaproteobacteria bacterium]
MPPSAFTADVAAAVRLASAPPLLRLLDRLRFTGQSSVSQRPGTTPVARATQASGLELAAHKPYTPGDDLRHVDWNALARLDQRVVKTFRAEREAPLHLLLDTSASMGAPTADAKLAFGAALAACCAYIALRHGNPVRAAALTAGNDGSRLSPLLRHPHRLPELYGFLAPLSAAGTTRLREGVDAYLRSTQLPGLVIVISDFLVDPSHAERAFDQLRGRGHDVVALRPLGALERDAAHLPRRVRLRDAESGLQRDVELSAAHRARYAAAMAAHVAHLRDWCAGRGIAFAAVDPAAGLSDCLLHALPRAGVLQ